MKLRVLLCLIACALSPAVQAQAIDPVRVSPDRYRVLLDNAEVRVIEYVLQPGQRDEWHTHPAKVSYVVNGGTLRITQPDGTSIVSEERTGVAQWRNQLGRHYATNIGKTPVRVVLMEVKNAAQGAPAAAFISPTAPSVPAAPSAPAFAAQGSGSDCLARMAQVPGRGTSTIQPARLQSSTPMPAFLPGGLRQFVASVVVDTTGRAEPATVKGPAELDSTAVNAIRAVIPEWRFSPARVAGCPVKQVVRMTFTR
jgi:beta-alanine degradation protein BauB